MRVKGLFASVATRLSIVSFGLSRAVMVAFVLTSIAMTLLFTGPGASLSHLMMAVVVLTSTACSWAVLALWRPICRRPSQVSARVWLALLGLVLANILRILINVLMAWIASSGSSVLENWLRVSVVALAIGVFVPCGVGIVETLARDRRRLTEALVDEQRRLRVLSESMAIELERVERDLRQAAHELLAPTVTQVVDLLDSQLSDAEAEALSLRISTAVNEVVRPTSHLMAVAPDFTPSMDPRGSGDDTRNVTDVMDVPGSIRPIRILLVCGLVLLPGPLLLGTSAEGLLLLILEGLAGASLLWAITRLWPQRWRYLKIPLGLAVAFLLLFAVQAAFQAVILFNIVLVFPPAWWTSLPWIGVLVRTVLSFIVIVATLLLDLGSRRREELARVNADLALQVAHVRRSLWVLHRSVSLAIHGPVQSALVSTAMRLSQPDRSEAALADARDRLVVALNAITQGEVKGVTLSERLDDLCELWQPVVSVSYAVATIPGSGQLDDAGLANCLIEVCREGVSNAIRHGGATNVIISMVEEPVGVVLTITDNGSGAHRGSGAGLGHTMLDEICLDWSLRSEGASGAVLRARLV